VHATEAAVERTGEEAMQIAETPAAETVGVGDELDLVSH
jgi:hypothetical protein